MRQFFILLFCICATSLALPQSRQLGNQASFATQKDRLSKAYKYRTDIDKKVLSITKKWPNKVGVLHSDWIENINGKSIDLNGHELFPQYDYTGLEQYCDSFFVMSVNGLKGVVTRNGKQLTKFGYWGFDFSQIDGGIILAKINAIGTGKTDIYSTNGNLLYSLEEYDYLHSEYNALYNNIIIVFFDSSGAKRYLVFFPDGDRACDVDLIGGDLLISSDKIIHRINDESISIQKINTDKPHPSLIESYRQDMYSLDEIDYNKNKWIGLFNNYYQAKKYKDALFCLDYYNLYEKQALRSDGSMPNFKIFTFDLKCREKLEDYKTVIDIIRSADLDHRLPFGLLYDPIERKLKFCMESLYSDEENKGIGQMVSDINGLYNTSIEGYKKKEVSRQQNAQFWGAMLGAAAATTLNVIAEFSTGASSSSKQSGNSGVKTTSVSSTPSSSGSSGGDNSSSSDELVTVEKYIKCTVCDGSGKCVHCGGTGKGVYNGKVDRCAACDGHPKCPSCHGRGYKIRYENVRKK